MMHSLHKKKIWALVTLVMLVTVTFEAAQQLFYINRFNLNGTDGFFNMFLNHLGKWLVWLFCAYFLMRHCKKLAHNQQLTSRHLFQLTLLIFALVFVAIFIISVYQYTRADLPFIMADFWHEWFLFFTFQKAPIYTLAYVCLAAISYYYFIGMNLQVELLKVDELNQEQQARYDHLKQRLQGAKQLLHVKVGQKQHMVPVTDISWIEADNYCVNIYTNHITPYALRSSLKALESQLPEQFIRVHRKAIVNMDQVAAFNQNGSNHLELLDGTAVTVAISKVPRVNAYLEEMIQNTSTP